MNVRTYIYLTATAALAASTTLAQSEFGSAAQGRTPSAPPTPPEIIEAAEATQAADLRLRSTAVLWDIGDPSPEEQLYIEMINRARANPVAEAQLFATSTDPDVVSALDYFDVNIPLMLAQFATNPPVPPLAPNKQLAAAARRHTLDMLNRSFQGHVGSDGSTVVDRIRDAGYVYQSVAENVYANADSVFHGHAGFEVDWGFGPGGMQTPPGHRNAIHSAAFREIGVGVVFGQNQPPASGAVAGAREVGPQLVTQELGRRNAIPLVTGVVYFDLNGNNIYDLGEGVGGVDVAVSGTATRAISARSGGYAIPVGGNGIYTVTFSGANFAPFTREITIVSAQNHKVDFRPVFTPPALSGSATPAINVANGYTITPVPAAAAYQWRSFQLKPAAIEGAESGAGGVTINQSGTYNVVQSATKKTGGFAFQLATPAAAIREQTLTLKPRFLVGSGSRLDFQSRLAWATSTTYSIVRVSTDDGATWQEVYRQNGTTGSPNETGFQSRSVNLAAFAGSIIRVRFSFLPTNSSYTETDNETGWFIDDILVGGSEITNEQISSEFESRAFTFQPTVAADFVLQARARAGHNPLPWGPMLNVRSAQGSVTPPSIQMSAISVANGRAVIDVNLLSGAAPTSWTLQSKNSVTGTWSTASTSVQAVSPVRFRFDVPATAGEAHRFFRVMAN